jgi:muconate cycloisomerase
MKITSIDIWTVVVPAIPDRVNSPEYGPAGWDDVPKHIFRLNTDEGVSGLGETKRGESIDHVRAGFERLKGRDPRSLSLQHIFTDRAVSRESSSGARDWESLGGWPGGPAYDAFEIAIYDIVGQTLGLPVHALLGGAYRDRVEVDYWMGRQNPEDSARSARRGFEEGYHGIKMKCTSDDPMVDRIRAILEATNASFKCTVDPNQRFYRPSEAIALARAFEAFGNVAVLEDPMAKWNLDWYRQLRDATSIQVALHLSNPHDIINAIKAEAVDCMNLVGSMAQFVKNAAIADAAGLPIWHGSGCDLGIVETSYLHAISVARNCVLPSDLVGSFVREDDLIAEGLRIERGQARVPDTPGLGCELDVQAVERYSVGQEQIN